jgi:integrase
VSDAASNGAAHDWRAWRAENPNAATASHSDAEHPRPAAAHSARANRRPTVEDRERVRLEGAQRGWRPSDYPPWYFATPVMPDYSPPAGARAHQIVGRVGEGRRAMSISIARSPGWERDPSGNVRWVPEDVVRRILPAPLELTEDEVESDRTYELHRREWYEWWWSQQALPRVAVQPERADAPRWDPKYYGHCGAVNAHSTEWCLGEDERKQAAMRQQAQLNADALLERGLLVPRANAAPSLADVALNRALFDRWRGAMRGDCSEEWWTIRGYHFDRLAEHFVNLAAVADESRRSEYNASALARCSAATVKKELGTLRSFAQWCKGQGWGFTPPEIGGPTKKQKGTRDPNRKGAAVEFSAAEVEALIAHLPEQTTRPRRKGTPRRPIREAVLVEWDTGLRPSTIERLCVPDHWQHDRPGELFIAAGIDKEEYERTLPLTPRLAELFARRAAALPVGEGLLFGEYQSALRTYWYDAAKAAGIDERRARKISVYDFRHAAAKRFLDATGNVRGTAFMLGHRNATGSTHRYTRPDKPAADRLVDALARPDASASAAPAASLVVALASPPASPGDSLDVPQPRDYSSVPPREGGGIGRRTSLRC